MMWSRICLALLLFLGEYIICSWQIPMRCPVVRLPNGRVRARARGRIIRFSCFDGFTLVGNRYSTCIRGEWDTPIPVCVKPVCPTPKTPEHALMAPKYNGAILIYFCEPGYALYGSAEIYCDGRQWNGTTPTCRDTTASAPTKCDFEKPDLCWWEQDPQHDFDWRRHNFETPSSHIGTGPTHDHTLGPGNDGYYLYIEASGRLVNDTARIISPIYKSSLTENGCFSFWYHMFGSTIGSLNVYFKQENATKGQLLFTKSGNQGNQWLHGFFDLPKSSKDFQIVLEGVRGSSYVSDIAVDDVAILQGDECVANRNVITNATTSDDDQLELVNAMQTCRGRCSNNITEHLVTMVPPSPTDACLCTLNCAEYSMCCPDYAEYCVLGFTEEIAQSTIISEVITEGRTTVVPVSPALKNVTTTVRPTTKLIHNRTGIPINPKDDIDPTNVTTKPFATTTTTKVTQKPTIMTTRMKTVNTTVKPTKATTKPSPIPTNAKQTKETPFLQATTLAINMEAEEHDSHVKVQDPEKLHRDGTKISLPGIIGLVIGILTGVSITMMVAFVIVRRRKNYKRGTNGSALSEDSDVRFLTSDEILDFNLARPTDNDEL